MNEQNKNQLPPPKIEFNPRDGGYYLSYFVKTGPHTFRWVETALDGDAAAYGLMSYLESLPPLGDQINGDDIGCETDMAMPIQLNGKRLGDLSILAGTKVSAIKNMAASMLSDTYIIDHVVVIPNKLVNIIAHERAKDTEGSPA